MVIKCMIADISEWANRLLILGSVIKCQMNTIVHKKFLDIIQRVMMDFQRCLEPIHYIYGVWRGKKEPDVLIVLRR